MASQTMLAGMKFSITGTQNSHAIWGWHKNIPGNGALPAMGKYDLIVSFSCKFTNHTLSGVWLVMVM